MKIFRLEYSDCRRGVYNIKNGALSVFSNYFNGCGGDSRHPMPSDDSLFMQSCEEKFGEKFHDLEYEEIRFGFKNVDQLRAWFFSDEGLIKLGECRVVLNVYEVPEGAVIIGHTQCAFAAEFHTEENILSTVQLKDLVEKGVDCAP